MVKKYDDVVAVISARTALGPCDIVTAIAEVVKFIWGYALIIIVVDGGYHGWGDCLFL